MGRRDRQAAAQQKGWRDGRQEMEPGHRVPLHGLVTTASWPTRTSFTGYDFPHTLWLSLERHRCD